MPLSNRSGFLLNSVGAEHAALIALRVRAACTASKLQRCLSEDCLELGGIYAVRVHQCRYDWFRQKLLKRRLVPGRRTPIPDVPAPTQSAEEHGASSLMYEDPADAPRPRPPKAGVIAIIPEMLAGLSYDATSTALTDN